MGLQDKAENKVENLKGKGKESAGKATGNEQLEAEGKGDQASSKVKDAVGDVKDGFKK